MAQYSELGPVQDDRDDDTDDDTDGEHRTTTVEQGRFCVARCACGWRGPARRARSAARADAEEHAADGG
ncbi:hypothetical protein ACFOOM_12900 [Streptomyces echinoruber]|uniref:hypothetical protein n=1 Tax=Streptomyces echinoruber TaxID=68898 RepID=UPI00167CFC6B|nr:hypothetical protein [Streptomyces echinoruber]